MHGRRNRPRFPCRWVAIGFNHRRLARQFARAVRSRHVQQGGPPMTRSLAPEEGAFGVWVFKRRKE